MSTESKKSITAKDIISFIIAVLILIANIFFGVTIKDTTENNNERLNVIEQNVEIMSQPLNKME